MTARPENEDRIPLVQRLDEISKYCRGKKVLHLGCADSPYTQTAIEAGSLLHFELEKIAGELYGFDFDDASLNILRERGSTNLYVADLEHLENTELDETFDVIVAGEMIEHLNNPGLFLDGIKRFMDGNTRLLVTTINAYCGMRFFRYGLTKRYGRNEPVHPDHVAYYSYSTLSLLLNRHGLAVERFMFCDLGREHRPTTPFIIRLFNDVSVRFASQWADGVFAVCRLADSTAVENSVDLEA